jgi:hypothetical protein
VVQDTHADVFERLHDLVGGVDVLLGGVALLSGVRSCRHEAELHRNAQLRFLPLVDELLYDWSSTTIA